MTSLELTEWAAYEQVYGSLLPHERIDVGFAQLSMILAQLWAKGEHTVREFMPAWYQNLTAEDTVRQWFEKQVRMADSGASDRDEGAEPRALAE